MIRDPVKRNALWIIACRLIQAGLQLVVGMLCARYLGPGNYGLIHYAASLTAFALPVMRLGLNETLVGELVADPESEGRILGTALTMNVLSALAAMGGVALFAAVMHPGDRETAAVCILSSVSLLFGALEMIRYWFQYRLLGRASSLILLAAYAAASGYRLWLLATGKGVLWFALTASVEYGLAAMLMLLLYRRQGRPLRFSRQRAGAMLRRSAPYIAASMMVVLFQSTDRIMLTAMAGAGETGLYSAAVTCATMAQFVFVALVDSVRPVLLAQPDAAAFGLRLSRLYGMVTALAAAQAVALTLGAEWLLGLLYGSAYLAAAPALRILGWYFVFSCFGLVRNLWILARQQQRYLWVINLSGALLNIALNTFWIPGMGARGAALASLLTQFFANFVMGWLIPPIRENNRLLLRGLCPAIFTKEVPHAGNNDTAA